MTDDALALRTATFDDFPAINRLLTLAFNDDLDEDEVARERLVFEPGRTTIITDGDEIVATAGAYTRDLTVPGAVLPASHVTMVGVAPTYRRRGLLRRLMNEQLVDAAARGETVAVLWASEGAIYQRYGYGLAAQRLMLEVDTPRLRLHAHGAGRLRAAEPTAIRKEMAEVYERLRPTRPGWSSRPEQWWDHRLADPKGQRQGATALRGLLHEGPSGVDGYALWRVKGDWDHSGPKGTVSVVEVAAENADAYLALWRFLLSVDLTSTVQYRFASVDEPLPHLVTEPRRIGGRLNDALWVRVVDVPGALSARRYAAPVDVVIDVTDPLLAQNSARYRLVGGPGGASCTHTTQPADLACDVGALSAAYLGGASLASLAAGGRIHELTAGALAPASAALGWTRAPAGIEVF
ncbi:MAG TPA: GNAT family N-acetyltransferase [Micromonosporaceae bacterium]